MAVYRVYVEKKSPFDVEAQGVLSELRSLLGIEGLTGLRLLNRYDVEGLDEALMREAIALAREADAEEEVPVGCVVTLDGRIVGRGRNRRERGRSALAHAEIEAIAEACRTLGGWRLWQCTLYVTLEPCPMCAGAIMNARIPRIVYGAKDAVNGCCGSAIDLFLLPGSQKPEIVQGVLEPECAALMSGFFRRLREKRKKPPVVG